MAAQTKQACNYETDIQREARGKKDDWKQFFQPNNSLKGPDIDFSEEGWAKPMNKKKKK